MAFVKFRCPTCSAVLKVDGDRARGGVTCPSCASLLQVPGLGPPDPTPVEEPEPPRYRRAEDSPPPPPRRRRPERYEDEDDWDDDYDDRPSRPQPTESRGQWTTVRVGLLLLILATAAVIGAIALNLIMAILFLLRAYDLVVSLRFISRFVIPGLAITAFFLDLAGLILQVFTPPRYASRPLILTVLGVTLLAYVLPFLGGVLIGLNVAAMATADPLNPAAARASAWGFVILMVVDGLLFFTARAILLPMFFREMAKSLKDSLTADRCETFMKVMLALAGLYVLLFLLLPILGGGLVVVLLPVALAVLVLWVVSIVLYLMICFGLREDVGDHLRSLRRRLRRAGRYSRR